MYFITITNEQMIFNSCATNQPANFIKMDICYERN